MEMETVAAGQLDAAVGQLVVVHPYSLSLSLSISKRHNTLAERNKTNMVFERHLGSLAREWRNNTSKNSPALSWITVFLSTIFIEQSKNLAIFECMHKSSNILYRNSLQLFYASIKYYNLFI